MANEQRRRKSGMKMLCRLSPVLIFPVPERQMFGEIADLAARRL